MDWGRLDKQRTVFHTHFRVVFWISSFVSFPSQKSINQINQEMFIVTQVAARSVHCGRLDWIYLSSPVIAFTICLLSVWHTSRCRVVCDRYIIYICIWQMAADQQETNNCLELLTAYEVQLSEVESRLKEVGLTSDIHSLVSPAPVQCFFFIERNSQRRWTVEFWTRLFARRRKHTGGQKIDVGLLKQYKQRTHSTVRANAQVTTTNRLRSTTV